MSSENDVSTTKDLYTTPIRHNKLTALSQNGSFGSPALKMPTTPMMTQLGYGTGVGVYLIERSPKPSGEVRSPWAVKKIAKQKETKAVYADRLTYEANILRQFSHPNIIGYRAFGTSIDNGPYLAMEKASSALGDLIECRLDECAGELDVDPFPAVTIEKVIKNVAKALAYLHDEKRMIHGDIKSANVLVFGDFDVIKLCDFGVARKLKPDGSVDGYYVGTEIWNPMEVIKQKRDEKHEKVTYKADIYPFGLTVYEMLSLRPPHISTAEESYIDDSTSADDSMDLSTNSNYDECAFEEALAKVVGTRPPLPNIEFDKSYSNVMAFFFCATDENPDKRPEAKDIVAVFETPQV